MKTVKDFLATAKDDGQKYFVAYTAEDKGGGVMFDFDLRYTFDELTQFDSLLYLEGTGLKDLINAGNVGEANKFVMSELTASQLGLI